MIDQDLARSSIDSRDIIYTYRTNDAAAALVYWRVRGSGHKETRIPVRHLETIELVSVEQLAMAYGFICMDHHDESWLWSKLDHIL